MIRILFSWFLGIFLYMPLVAVSTPQEHDINNPMQLVNIFQKRPPYEIFCKDENMGSAEPYKVGAKFETYLSKSFYTLYLWTECGQPETLPHYDPFKSLILWDFRFGFDFASSGGYSAKVKNIRIKPAQYQGPDKATVKLIFDPTNYNLKNITTIYTLIREDGHWKIDDIAPKGDPVTEENNGDTVFERSDSIKTDMQNNYNAAMERYKKEQVNNAK